MFDYQTMMLMHRHGDHEWAEMTEEPHHSQAAHDPERKLLRARFFRCVSCDEVIAVTSEAKHEGKGEHSHG
jgi:hypothetical protein